MSTAPPTEAQLIKYYDVALDLVMKCATVFQEGYNKAEASFEVKAAYYDLVTVYDKQIEDILIEGLQNEFPESKVIGEEQANASEAQLTNDPTWIIDPIDGTNNFINRIPHCCISVGLAVNKELVVGVIYNPILNEMFSARKGHGAYLNGERIQVSQVTSIKDAVIAFEVSLLQGPTIRDKNAKRLYKLASNARGVRSMGSAAEILCYVASGRFQSFHVDDLKPWDIAAGAIILTEAGGFIINTNGGPYDIMKPDIISACTEELLNEVKELIEEANQINEFKL